MLGDMYKSLTINGWAIVETFEDNSDAWTDIILINDKNCYRLGKGKGEPFDGKPREDVVNGCKDKNIPSHYIGFAHCYSGYAIRDGEYDIYLYRWENEENYGLVYSKTKLIIQDGSAELKRV